MYLGIDDPDRGYNRAAFDCHCHPSQGSDCSGILGILEQGNIMEPRRRHDGVDEYTMKGRKLGLIVRGFYNLSPPRV